MAKQISAQPVGGRAGDQAQHRHPQVAAEDHDERDVERRDAAAVGLGQRARSVTVRVRCWAAANAWTRLVSSPLWLTLAADATYNVSPDWPITKPAWASRSRTSARAWSAVATACGSSASPEAVVNRVTVCAASCAQEAATLTRSRWGRGIVERGQGEQRQQHL